MKASLLAALALVAATALAADPPKAEDDPIAAELLKSKEAYVAAEWNERQIEDDYRDKPLTIVAVLTGSLIALADLVRQIRIPLRIALLQASSYRGATTSATTGWFRLRCRMSRRDRAGTSAIRTTWCWSSSA